MRRSACLIKMLSSYLQMRRLWHRTARLAALWLAAGVLVVLQQTATSNEAFANQTPAAADGQNATPIILISVDTLRADRLSCYGYKGPATTHIDRIAAGGTTFLEANSQVPLTLPSHV